MSLQNNHNAKGLFRLDGKVAIVTGAARGLGAAATKVLQLQGATVAASDINFEGVAELASHLGEPVKPYRADMAQTNELQALVKDVVRDFGRIDIVVNNAAVCPRLPFVQSTEADWEEIVGVNARGQFFLMQLACDVMKHQGGGRIINVVSTAGRVGALANASIYSGSKGAVTMFSKSVAREVAADNILINCVAPGAMDTDLMRNLPPERVASICEQIPLKRLGNPEEVAAVIAFMASDECSYVTGATFDVNGGWVML